MHDESTAGWCECGYGPKVHRSLDGNCPDVPKRVPPARLSLRFWRCYVGMHRLKAWRAPDGGPNACPMPPRALPGPGDHRRCESCGARWEGAYDWRPFWQRVA